MSTTHQQHQQTASPPKLPSTKHISWTTFAKSIDYLAIPLALLSIALNIIIILNIIYCILLYIGTILISIGQILTTSENIIGFIAIIYCAAILGFGYVVVLDIAEGVSEEGRRLALVRLLQAEELMDMVETVLEPVPETVIKPVPETSLEPVPEIVHVRPVRPVHRYSNLTC